MSPENQTLVRDSFAKIVPIASQAAAIFYDRLFVLDPSLKPLFKGDMTEQGRKLMAMLGTAVANLHKLEVIVPAVQDLGRRYAAYGVQPAHYDTVASALLWTLWTRVGRCLHAAGGGRMDGSLYDPCHGDEGCRRPVMSLLRSRPDLPRGRYSRDLWKIRKS